MTFFKKKDKKFREFLRKNELKLLFYKLIATNINIALFFKKKYRSSLLSPKVRINAACMITGRVGGVFKKFRVSRLF